MLKNDVRNIITIGASAGGIAAVSKLVASFKKEFDAAIFVVIHISRNSLTEIILGQIQKQTAIKCLIPADGEEIQNSRIYLAPADHHMMLEKGKVSIKRGAFDNHWRPSIDVLFRSAAAAYDSCVTGIILTGLLDDGTSGMSAIRRSGGKCMVQDPKEADFPDMPQSVLKNMTVDYKVSIHEMGYILSDLFSRSICNIGEVPEDIQIEAEISLRMSSNVEGLKKLGHPTWLTCPECGGVLVKVERDEISRYRCYTGHSFTEKILETEQAKGLEESIWIAIRMMEERKNLLTNMTVLHEETRAERTAQMSIHIDRLKGILIDLSKK